MRLSLGTSADASTAEIDAPGDTLSSRVRQSRDTQLSTSARGLPARAGELDAARDTLPQGERGSPADRPLRTRSPKPISQEAPVPASSLHDSRRDSGSRPALQAPEMSGPPAGSSVGRDVANTSFSDKLSAYGRQMPALAGSSRISAYGQQASLVGGGSSLSSSAQQLVDSANRYEKYTPGPADSAGAGLSSYAQRLVDQADLGSPVDQAGLGLFRPSMRSPQPLVDSSSNRSPEASRRPSLVLEGGERKSLLSNLMSSK